MTASDLDLSSSFTTASIWMPFLNGVVGCNKTIISAFQFSFFSSHLTACFKTEKVGELSLARFFGLIKGMSAPAFFAIFNIFLYYEEKIVLVSILLLLADLIAN